MNLNLFIPEIAVTLIAMAILVIDVFTPKVTKPWLGYLAALLIFLVFIGTLFISPEMRTDAFGLYQVDSLALFFKRLFLLITFLVLIIGVEFSRNFEAGVGEFYVLLLISLVGMMVIASVSDFIMLFVALELITVSFYVMVSYLRHKAVSLEAGMKYLVLGALSSGFLVYGIAFIIGTTGVTNFHQLNQYLVQSQGVSPGLLFGVVLVIVGLGFKIAAFPFQIWVPDVYQGAPAPVTAMLAVGSKAAGFVILMRVLIQALGPIQAIWAPLIAVLAGATILYGNLGAVAQKNIKRLLAYSGIAHAGYLLLGFVALDLTQTTASAVAGEAAVLFYLTAYAFTVIAAFTVIIVVYNAVGSDNIDDFAGLRQRSPVLAATMALSMVSLAGIPPLAGFFGKFLLFKALVQKAIHEPSLFWLLGIAIFGVVVSLYYYLGIIRVMYFEKAKSNEPIMIGLPIQGTIVICMIAILWYGIRQDALLERSTNAVQALHQKPPSSSEQGQMELAKMPCCSTANNRSIAR